MGVASAHDRTHSRPRPRPRFQRPRSHRRRHRDRLPRAIALGTAALIGIYLFANIGYVAALGPAGVAGSDRVAAEAVGQAAGPAGPWAAKLVAAAILISVFSAMNGLTITTPRMYYQMAQDGLFFRKLAEVHPRFGTPAVAIVIGSLWATLRDRASAFRLRFLALAFLPNCT